MAGHAAVRGPVPSPVLVGRDGQLALAARRLDEAAAGRGGILLAAGEAGIGKTRLLDAVARRAAGRGFAVARAAAFAGDAESTGGVLLDLAGGMRRADDAGLAACGAALAARLRESAPDVGDAHRLRRLLVQDLTDLLLDIGARGPALLVLDDLHWADQLSLQVVEHAARGIRELPLLLTGAFRSDELFPGTAMRAGRSRLLTQRLAEEIRLGRLTRSETATLASSVLGRAAPERVAAALHERSDGIPLHVEEFLAVLGEEESQAAPDESLRALPAPATLAEAVLSRAEVLDAPSRRLATAAAVIGRHFDLDLLAAVSELDPVTVAEGLRGLQNLYLVVARPDGDSYGFGTR